MSSKTSAHQEQTITSIKIQRLTIVGKIKKSSIALLLAAGAPASTDLVILNSAARVRLGQSTAGHALAGRAGPVEEGDAEVEVLAAGALVEIALALTSDESAHNLGGGVDGAGQGGGGGEDDGENGGGLHVDGIFGVEFGWKLGRGL